MSQILICTKLSQRGNRTGWGKVRGLDLKNLVKYDEKWSYPLPLAFGENPGTSDWTKKNHVDRKKEGQ